MDSRHLKRYDDLMRAFGKIPAPWEFHPDAHPYSMTWRMGDGESYMEFFGQWFEQQDWSLEEQARFFIERNPPPAWLLWITYVIFPEHDPNYELEMDPVASLMALRSQMEALGFTGIDAFETDFNSDNWR